MVGSFSLSCSSPPRKSQRTGETVLRFGTTAWARASAPVVSGWHALLSTELFGDFEGPHFETPWVTPVVPCCNSLIISYYIILYHTISIINIMYHYHSLSISHLKSLDIRKSPCTGWVMWVSFDRLLLGSEATIISQAAWAESLMRR